MIESYKIFQVQTPQEAFELTNTNSLKEAREVVELAYAKESKSLKTIRFKIIFVCIEIGLFWLGSLFTPARVLCLFLAVAAVSMRLSRKKRLQQKFDELNALIQVSEKYPELSSGASLTTFAAQSLLMSCMTTVSREGRLLVNNNVAVHPWSKAGFFCVNVGNDQENIWQNYYFFSYQFDGSSPHIFLSHPNDPFSPSKKLGARLFLRVALLIYVSHHLNMKSKHLLFFLLILWNRYLM